MATCAAGKWKSPVALARTTKKGRTLRDDEDDVPWAQLYFQADYAAILVIQHDGGSVAPNVLADGGCSES